MFITACLSFFDEPPELLNECIVRLGRIGVDRLVAIDGPYALYPHTSTRSTPEAIDAIRTAAKAGGIDLTLIQCDRAWEGNEVGKRQRMLDIARGSRPRSAWKRAACERDWLLIVDADHFWETDGDLHELLALGGSARPMDFARISFSEVFEPDGTPIYAPARPLMRARFDLQMGSNHYTYVTDDGFSTFLERPSPTAPAIDLMRAAHVVHRVHERDFEKRARQVAYYQDRDATGAEQ